MQLLTSYFIDSILGGRSRSPAAGHHGEGAVGARFPDFPCRAQSPRRTGSAEASALPRGAAIALRLSAERPRRELRARGGGQCGPGVGAPGWDRLLSPWWGTAGLPYFQPSCGSRLGGGVDRGGGVVWIAGGGGGDPVERFDRGGRLPPLHFGGPLLLGRRDRMRRILGGGCSLEPQGG